MIAVVTNIDNDHLGAYGGDVERLQQAFGISCTTCRSTASRSCAVTTMPRAS
jgi:UDP-N-acetylmuramate-alanine ligase